MEVARHMTSLAYADLCKVVDAREDARAGYLIVTYHAPEQEDVDVHWKTWPAGIDYMFTIIASDPWNIDDDDDDGDGSHTYRSNSIPRWIYNTHATDPAVRARWAPYVCCSPPLPQ